MLLQIHRQKQINNLLIHDIAKRFYNETGDIPWVIAQQMFQSHKWFPINIVLKHKTTPDIIAQLIAYFGKNSIHQTNDDAILNVVENENLTNETKLEICVMLIES